MLEENFASVACSMLPTQTFCEYQIYLEYVKGYEGELLEEAQIGIEIHELLYEDFKQKADVPTNFIDFLLNKKGTLIIRELMFDDETPLFWLVDEKNNIVWCS